MTLFVSMKNYKATTIMYCKKMSRFKKLSIDFSPLMLYLLNFFEAWTVTQPTDQRIFQRSRNRSCGLGQYYQVNVTSSSVFMLCHLMEFVVIPVISKFMLSVQLRQKIFHHTHSQSGQITIQLSKPNHSLNGRIRVKKVKGHHYVVYSDRHGGVVVKDFLI